MSLHEHDILVTGATGFLGGAVCAQLLGQGIEPERLHRPGSGEFDLLDPARCRLMFDALLGRAGSPSARRLAVIHCAGFVGGLGLNRLHPARMLHDNLLMGLHLLQSAAEAGLAARGCLVLVGSMTAYPADAAMPVRESSLFAGRPDGDIAAYGTAKLALIEALRAYAREHGLVSACPVLSNLFGPGDEVDDPLIAHAAGALLKRFADAARAGTPEIVCWGTGAPTRDFLFVDDAARGVIRCAEHAAAVAASREGQAARAPAPEPLVVNLSSGQEVSLRELATLLAELTGYAGRVTWDASKGDGVARRVLDPGLARQTLGWSAHTPLREGLALTLDWYRRRASR